MRLLLPSVTFAQERAAVAEAERENVPAESFSVSEVSAATPPNPPFARSR